MANNSNNTSDYLNPASQVMIQQIEEANHNAERAYWWMKGIDREEAQRLGLSDMVQAVLLLLQKVDNISYNAALRVLKNHIRSLKKQIKEHSGRLEKGGSDD